MLIHELKFHLRSVVVSVAAAALAFCANAAAAQAGKPAAADALSAAICPIVFPLDQFPTADGYHYYFYGNAFFINEDGYLITAAHVVNAFREGDPAHILVGPPGGPRRLLQADLVAADWDHDVAVLRATPNPFKDNHDLAYLPLAPERLAPGKSILSLSLRPSDLHNSHTSEEPVEERSRGQIIDYLFARDDNPSGQNRAAESELFLTSQRVAPGQSGSPVISADSQAVVGIVVGQWQHPAVVHSAATAPSVVAAPGAALRVHYAISLLQSHGISWHPALAAAVPPQAPAQNAGGYSPPVPISLVTTPYPPQALFGGEIVLDALVGANGQLEDLTVVRGDEPFLDPVLQAVRTWAFSPAQLDGRAVESRIGIVFQFPQSFLPKLVPGTHTYQEPSADIPSRAPLPVATIEPDYPVNTVTEGSVALLDMVDARGGIVSTRVLRDVPPLTAAAQAATEQWRFAPGRQAGAGTESAVIEVFTFRRP